MDRTKTIACILTILLFLTVAACKKTPPLSVGSKNFTEQVILGEIIAQHVIQKLKINVEKKLNMGGTLLVHQSMESGQIDVYPEYTGTGLSSILKLNMTADPQGVFDRVREVYRSSYQMEWLDPLGFDNSFVMAVRRNDSDVQNIATLSDAENYQPGWKLGIGYEFESRPDGMPKLNTAYRLPFNGAPATMDLGLLYKALEQKQVNMIAANATDGQLSKDTIKTLTDDRHAFPPYQAALVVRGKALETYPELRKVLLQLSGKISAETMRKMNYAVDVEHSQPAEVAAGFLHSAGLQ
ncbi:MAG TPA: glycine betaine ABC transporter substrate-binding protein [Bryobacteraceae bacterium]|nr:glycine betaine ABC transporter substrate-binding protein [Bryobacteraceae bacterium]